MAQAFTENMKILFTDVWKCPDGDNDIPRSLLGKPFMFHSYSFFKEKRSFLYLIPSYPSAYFYIFSFVLIR